VQMKIEHCSACEKFFLLKLNPVMNKRRKEKTLS